MISVALIRVICTEAGMDCGEIEEILPGANAPQLGTCWSLGNVLFVWEDGQVTNRAPGGLLQGFVETPEELSEQVRLAIDAIDKGLS